MARPNSSDSARRLIALLGQLTPGMSVPVKGLAESLGTTEAQLADDLGTLCVCGIAPYGPDQMLDVFVEDGMLEVYTALPAVRGPISLSPSEAQALAAALAAAGFSARDPLARRLLDAAASSFDGEALEQTLRTTIATHESTVFEILAAAALGREAVSISYQSEGTAEPSDRIIEPQQLFAERGAWYVAAWCRTADGIRTFRVDRVRKATATGEHFDRVTVVERDAAPTAFAPEGLPVARLRFAAVEAFVSRDWPGGHVVSAEEDGTTIADVPFSGTEWIARRVTGRLGRVEALAPVHVRDAVATAARAELG